MVKAQQVDFNQNPMMDMMWGMIGKQIAKLPPEARDALAQTEVKVMKKENSVEIEPVLLEDNENTRKVRAVLVNGFTESLPGIINKAFQVKVKVYK